MKTSTTEIKSIDDYINTFPIQIQHKLQEIRQIIHGSAPGAEEAIRYQMPTFRYKNKNLIHFAAFTNHIGIYPAPAAIEKFINSLKNYKTSKGTIQLPNDLPLPLDLITEITLFRVKEIDKNSS